MVIKFIVVFYVIFVSGFSATRLHLSDLPFFVGNGSSVTKSSEYSMQSAVFYITLWQSADT